ncbi:MAG: lysophospholipid acyltransferase family protein [Candidatus Paceibacterota bacterium]
MKKIVSIISWVFPGQYIKRMFVKEIIGRENFPKGNFIFAANHLSHIDWLIDGAVLTPRKFTFIAQVDKMTGIKGLLRDLLYWWAQVIPVNRNERESKKSAALAAEAMIKRGYCLIIYPEGTRSRDGQLHEFKPGVARLHLETGVPVLPVAHFGTYELMPPGQKFKAKRVVTVKIGKPLDFAKEREAAILLDKKSQAFHGLCRDVAGKIEEAVGELLKD